MFEGGMIYGELARPAYPLERHDNFHLISRHGTYTEPYLTRAQWAAVVGASSFMGSVLARPLHHLDRFFFLGYSPADMPVADKRPMLFETITSSKWLKSNDGRTIPLLTMSNFMLIMSYEMMFYGLVGGDGKWGWLRAGFYAGAGAGALRAAVSYPLEVLTATARASKGTPHEMRGTVDVLRTALRHKPEVLRGLYRGFGPVLIGHTLQGACIFGCFNGLKYDMNYFGTLQLFCLSWFVNYTGYFVLYPFLSAKAMLRQTNAALRRGRVGYAEMLSEINKRYGITYVFRGAFSASPSLAVLPLSFALFFTDFAARGLTEKWYPERKRGSKFDEYNFQVVEHNLQRVQRGAAYVRDLQQTLRSPAAIEQQKRSQDLEEARQSKGTSV